MTQRIKNDSTLHGPAPIFRVLQLCVLLALVVVSGALGGAAPVKNAAIVAKCTADLAQRLKLPVKEITVIEAQATTWPDAALGMPENGKMYAQVLTPGWKIVLEARRTRYLYTAGRTAFRFGGPAALWAYSMLYLQPVPDEPNLNSDLYQCSLTGTNSVRLAVGVTEFYPQEHGMVIVKRRTSRSSHELLLVNAAKQGKDMMLHGAFDFGPAALNGAQDTWAGYVRPRLGSDWSVVVARLGEDAVKQTLPLPDGVRPGQIAWADDRLMIAVTMGERTTFLALDPHADAPTWKAADSFTFPGALKYVLSKSQTLEISQVPGEDKPCVEVAKVWFTDERDVVAKIDSLTLRGYDLLGAYAMIWGEQDGTPAAYAVQIGTGEVTPGYHGACLELKPFNYPPKSAPFTLPQDA